MHVGTLDHVFDLALHGEHKEGNEVEKQDRPKHRNVEKAEKTATGASRLTLQRANTIHTVSYTHLTLPTTPYV